MSTRGMTLVEMMVGLALMAGVVGLASKFVVSSVESTQNQNRFNMDYTEWALFTETFAADAVHAQDLEWRDPLTLDFKIRTTAQSNVVFRYIRYTVTDLACMRSQASDKCHVLRIDRSTPADLPFSPTDDPVGTAIAANDPTLLRNDMRVAMIYWNVSGLTPTGPGGGPLGGMTPLEFNTLREELWKPTTTERFDLADPRVLPDVAAGKRVVLAARFNSLNAVGSATRASTMIFISAVGAATLSTPSLRPLYRKR